MRVGEALLTAMIVFAPVAARAEVIQCAPYEFAWWMGSEFGSTYAAEADAEARTFTIDLATGAFHRNATADLAAKDVNFEVLRTGEYGTTEEVDFVAFHRDSAALIRVRLTNGELQFLHDYGRTLETGTCSSKQETENDG